VSVLLQPTRKIDRLGDGLARRRRVVVIQRVTLVGRGRSVRVVCDNGGGGTGNNSSPDSSCSQRGSEGKSTEVLRCRSGVVGRGGGRGLSLGLGLGRAGLSGSGGSCGAEVRISRDGVGRIGQLDDLWNMRHHQSKNIKPSVEA